MRQKLLWLFYQNEILLPLPPSLSNSGEAVLLPASYRDWPIPLTEKQSKLLCTGKYKTFVNIFEGKKDDMSNIHCVEQVPT